MGQQNKNHNSTFVVTTIEQLSRQTEGETDIATDIYRNKTKQEEQDSHIRTDRCKHTKNRGTNTPTDRKRKKHTHRQKKKQPCPQTLEETNIATDIIRNKHCHRHKQKQTYPQT